MYCITNRPRQGTTLFPYTTLFRSLGNPAPVGRCAESLPRPRGCSDLPPRAAPWKGCRRNLRRCRYRPCCFGRSEEHTSELQSQFHLVCRLLLEKKKTNNNSPQLDC